MGVLYYRDLIAERDSKNKLHNAIVKWWQVNYNEDKVEVSKPMESVDTSNAIDAGDEDLKFAEEVYERLHAEKEADEAVLIAQMNEAYEQAAAAEAERIGDENYNAATGAYSGAYGTDTNLDRDEQEQVESIMGEKEATLRALISDTQN